MPLCLPQVAKSFAKLRNAVVPAELAAACAEAGAREYPTLLPGAVPPEAFPLFLSSRQFLRMLDGGPLGAYSRCQQCRLPATPAY